MPDNIQAPTPAKHKVGRAARKEYYNSLSAPDLFATAAAELNRGSDERLINLALESEDPRERMIGLLLDRGDRKEDEEIDSSLTPPGAAATVPSIAMPPPPKSSLAMRLRAAGAAAAMAGKVVKLAPAGEARGEAAESASMPQKAPPHLKRLRVAGAVVMAGSAGQRRQDSDQRFRRDGFVLP